MQAETATPNPTQTAAPASNGAATELSIQQIAALDALLAGSTATDAAAAAGVDRKTLHNWLRKNFGFQAALNRGRKDLRQAVVHRLERLANNATECVDKAVRGGDVKAALEIVKRLDVFSGRYLGSDDATELELDEEERNQKVHERSNRASERADRLNDAKTLRGMYRK